MSGATAARISIRLEDRGSDLKVLVDSYIKRVTHQMFRYKIFISGNECFFFLMNYNCREGESQSNNLTI